MKSYILLLSVSMLFVSCKKNQEMPEPSQKEIATYEIINFVMSDPEITNKNTKLLDKLRRASEPGVENFGISEKDTFFTKEDIAFMQEQDKDTTALLIEKTKLTQRIVMIPSDTIDKLLKRSYDRHEGLDSFWTEVRKRYGDGGFNYISKPLFSKDYKKAIITIGHSCGSLCGSGFSCILIREKNKWRIVTTTSRWIS